MFHWAALGRRIAVFAAIVAAGVAPRRAATAAEHEPPAIVCVVDVSGSMEKDGDASSDRDRYRAAAARLLTCLADEGQPVGFVTFSNDVVFPPSGMNSIRRITGDAAREALLREQIGAEASDRGTDIVWAIRRTHRMLTRDPPPGGAALILLTDGLQDADDNTDHGYPATPAERVGIDWIAQLRTPLRLLVAAQGMPRHRVLSDPGVDPDADVLGDFVRRGWHIHCVALGEKANSALLQGLATATGGGYHRVRNPVDMLDVYSRIAGQELREFRTARADFRVAEGTRTLKIIVSNPVDASGLAPGRLIREVVGPDGRVYPDPARGAWGALEADYASRDESGRRRPAKFEAVIVKDPKPGAWHVVGERSPVHVTTFAQRGLGLEIESPPTGVPLDRDEPLVVRVRLEGAGAATALVSATLAITRDHDRTVSLPLAGSGAFEGSLPAPGRDGTFNLEVTAESDGWSGSASRAVEFRRIEREIALDLPPAELRVRWPDRDFQVPIAFRWVVGTPAPVTLSLGAAWADPSAAPFAFQVLDGHVVADPAHSAAALTLRVTDSPWPRAGVAHVRVHAASPGPRVREPDPPDVALRLDAGEVQVLGGPIDFGSVESTSGAVELRGSLRIDVAPGTKRPVGPLSFAARAADRAATAAELVLDSPDADLSQRVATLGVRLRIAKPEVGDQSIPVTVEVAPKCGPWVVSGTEVGGVTAHWNVVRREISVRAEVTEARVRWPERILRLPLRVGWTSGAPAKVSLAVEVRPSDAATAIFAWSDPVQGLTADPASGGEIPLALHVAAEPAPRAGEVKARMGASAPGVVVRDSGASDVRLHLDPGEVRVVEGRLDFGRVEAGTTSERLVTAHVEVSPSTKFPAEPLLFEVSCDDAAAGVELRLESARVDLSSGSGTLALRLHEPRPGAGTRTTGVRITVAAACGPWTVSGLETSGIVAAWEAFEREVALSPAALQFATSRPCRYAASAPLSLRSNVDGPLDVELAVVRANPPLGVLLAAGPGPASETLAAASAQFPLALEAAADLDPGAYDVRIGVRAKDGRRARPATLEGHLVVREIPVAIRGADQWETYQNLGTPVPVIPFGAGAAPESPLDFASDTDLDGLVLHVAFAGTSSPEDMQFPPGTTLEWGGTRIALGAEATVPVPPSKRVVARLVAPSGVRGVALVRISAACRAVRWPGGAKRTVLAVQR